MTSPPLTAETLLDADAETVIDGLADAVDDGVRGADHELDLALAEVERTGALGDIARVAAWRFVRPDRDAHTL